MKRKLLSLVLALVLILSVGIPALAADSQNVTVTATPLYLAITNDPATWTLNGITGAGTISPDTIYYSNPLGDTTAPAGANVVDGECRFTVTCSAGATTCDLTVNCGNFAGGDANMNNSDTGANGATDYGAYSWYSGILYASKVVMKSAGSAELYSSGLAATATLKWGAEIETQTNAWSGNSSSTATMTITATEH